ncbi:MAG: DUF6470 family protein [Halanaerobium sp.]|nr:DUF6470 family protein [Halanaerobium sp.]
MNIPHIQITQQYARVELEKRGPQLQLHSEKPAININQQQGRVKVKQREARVKVDSYPVLYDLGYRKPKDIVRDGASKGKEEVSKLIARYASEGDRMMALEKEQGNLIARFAEEEAFTEHKELNIKFKRGPDIRVTDPKLKVDCRPGKIISNYKPGIVGVNFVWGGIDLKLNPRAEIEVDVIGGRLDYLA